MKKLFRSLLPFAVLSLLLYACGDGNNKADAHGADANQNDAVHMADSAEADSIDTNDSIPEGHQTN